MPRRKSPKDHLSKARGKGSEECKKVIDGSVSLGRVGPRRLRAYERMVDMWHQFVSEKIERIKTEGLSDDPPNPYDLKSLKDFVTDIALGIDGAEDDPNPGEGTVLQYWKEFTAGWRRGHDAIPGNITLPVRNFILSDLPGILKERGIEMVKKKRSRRYGTKNHFLHLGRQLWGNDWLEYAKPATRVYDWAQLMAIVCSSARVGEYIESSCRSGSGRGLYFKDVTFGVFRNEHGNAEFAVQLVRDAKGMTHTPDKRPEHVIYEGLGPMPLICNAMPPILAILVAAKALRDFDTIEELLALAPPDGEMVQLYWKDSVLDQPFFKSMSARKTSGKIETAGAFSKRLTALGYRAGYPRPPTIHDFRAEGLYWIDQLYSLAQRMKHAGQKDPSTYNNHYQPNNSGTDGQGSYFGSQVRTVVNDLFRGLTLERNPQLFQSLPAERFQELRMSPEFVAIEEELAGLLGRQDPDSISRRSKLYSKRRGQIERHLKQCRKSQRHQPNPTVEDAGLVCYHQSLFNRVKFLMPERNRLASSLLETDTLRSPTGLRALRDMIALCEADAEVEFRPGLEPEKCQCDGSTRRRILSWSSRSGTNAQPAYDWKHIYNCFKKTRSGFAELCFLCDEWVFGELEWSNHCRSHLDRPETLPAQCDPLVYGGVLATAGYCLFCLADATMTPESRLHQFLDKGFWKDHVNGHYERYMRTVDESSLACPHPGTRCGVVFDSATQLKFHLLDTHGPDFIKELDAFQLSKQEDDVKLSLARKRKRSNSRDPTVNQEYHFIDETAETLRRQSSPRNQRDTSASTTCDSAAFGPLDSAASTAVHGSPDLLEHKISTQQSTPAIYQHASSSIWSSDERGSSQPADGWREEAPWSPPSMFPLVSPDVGFIDDLSILQKMDLPEKNDEPDIWGRGQSLSSCDPINFSGEGGQQGSAAIGPCLPPLQGTSNSPDANDHSLCQSRPRIRLLTNREWADVQDKASCNSGAVVTEPPKKRIRIILKSRGSV